MRVVEKPAALEGGRADRQDRSACRPSEEEVEAKLKQVGGLIAEIDRLNALCKGREPNGAVADLLEGRDKLLGEVRQILATIVSDLPPKAMFPPSDGRSGAKWRLSRKLGLIPKSKTIAKPTMHQGTKATPTGAEETPSSTYAVEYAYLQSLHPHPSPAHAYVSPYACGPLTARTESASRQGDMASINFTDYSAAVPGTHDHGGALPQQYPEPRPSHTPQAEPRPPPIPLASPVESGLSKVACWRTHPLPPMYEIQIVPKGSTQPTTTTFHGTVDLPFSQRLEMNLEPLGPPTCSEKDVRAEEILSEIRKLAVDPIGVCRGSIPVNKAALNILMRAKVPPAGRKHDVEDQIKQCQKENLAAANAAEDMLQQAMPTDEYISALMREVFEKRKKESDQGFSYKRMRIEFEAVLQRLHPWEAKTGPKCTDFLIKSYMEGNKNTLFCRILWWRHAILHWCALNGMQIPLP